MGIGRNEIKIIDLNLFSGSSDTLRTALGGYFYVYSSSYGEYPATVAYPVFPENYIYDASRNSELNEVASDSAIIPTQKYPVRVYGYNDVVPADEFWKAYWIGGTYGDESYDGIYSEDVFDDYWFTDDLPYSKFQVANLVGGSSVKSEIEISYDYNFYLKNYQSYASALGSELLIPNMYLIQMFARTYLYMSDVDDLDGILGEDDDVKRNYDDTIWDFVTLDGAYLEDTGTSDRRKTYYLSSDISAVLLDVIESDNNQVSGRGTGQIHAKGSDRTLYDLHLHRYLTGSVPYAMLSSSTTTYVQNALQNIMFDQNSIANEGNLLSTFVDMETNKEAYPYYVKINFLAHGIATPDGSDGSEFNAAAGDDVYFAESIEDNNYSSKFLKSLKEAFLLETPKILPTIEEYVMTQNYFTSTEDATTDTKVLSAENTSFTTVDFFDLLTYSYNNYESITDNCYFVGEKSITREAAMDTTGTYRYMNSKNALGVLRDTLATLVEAGSTSTAEIFNENLGLKKLFNGWRGTSAVGKYNETVAYRIEKIGGAASGDYNKQKVLQNFWIFNSPNLIDDINLYDSQIKYGEDYTYVVYKYVVVVGAKYGTSDLVLSKLVSENDDTDPKTYNLEYYDPTTDEIADQLVDPDGGSSYEGTYYNYHADFNVTIQPTIRIFEIPMFTKTLKVLDNPPNQVNLNPFFLLDNSQTIGFRVNYETFVKEKYPTGISSADTTRKTAYLNANDMLTDSDLTLESRSQQRYLQAYRIKEMPTSLTDFDENLISTTDLLIENSIYTLPSTIFYDKINTNQKYYYLFRVLNENMMPGHLSAIYEAELINDGGYVYGMFNLLFEEDLETDDFTNPSIAFKKLIQLQPNVSQISLNDGDIDYGASATDEIANMSLGDVDDPIWDKTFKVRLTSKKTGRKIDLNVTYKYNIDNR